MSVHLGSGQSIRLESQTVISWQGQYCCEEEEKSPWFQKLHVRLQDYIPVINVQDFHLYMFRISCHICLGFLVTRMRRISRLSRPIISLLPSLSPPSTPLIICRIIYTSLFKAAIIYQSMLWSQDLLPAPTAFIRARTIHTQCVTCATVPFSQSTHWSLFSNLSWQLRSLHRRWLEGIISRCHFTPACQWSSWSTWLELNQMIATGWSAFDCLIATSHVSCQCNVLYEL